MEITIVKIVLALIFTLSVGGKLSGKTKSTFENAGFSPMFMYATAIAEIAGIIGLFSRFEVFATIGLFTVIGGAILTLFHQKAKPAKYTLALITAALLIVLLLFQISKSPHIQEANILLMPG